MYGVSPVRSCQFSNVVVPSYTPTRGSEGMSGVPHPCRHSDFSAHTKEGFGVVLSFLLPSPLRTLAFTEVDMYCANTGNKRGKVPALGSSRCGGGDRSGKNYYFRNGEAHAKIEIL